MVKGNQNIYLAFLQLFRQIARLGEYDLTRDDDASNPIDFAIAKTIVHERYEPDIILNDIAIVKLKRQVPVNG